MHSSRLHAKPASCRQAARAFAAAGVLAAGLMPACKGEPEWEPPPYVRAPKPSAAPKERADAHMRGETRGCPEWMVRVTYSPNDFCIDRFEAYVVRIQGEREVPHPSSVRPTTLLLRARVSPGVFPQSSIDRPQAEAACKNAGKRLCTLREWKKACRGAEAYTYPYGNDEERGKCNTRKSHLPTYFFGPDARTWDMDDPLLNRVPGFLAKTGTHPECMSSYGVFDMVGNLHEWVSTPVDASMIASRPKDKVEGSRFSIVPGNGVFMGGFFSNSDENGPGCHYWTIAHPPSHHDYSTGFRCCRDAE